MRRMIPVARVRPGAQRATARAGAKTLARWRIRVVPGRRRRGPGGVILRVAPGRISAGWLWHSGWLGRQAGRAGQALLAATAQAGLKVDEVLVEGRRRSKRSAILEALRVERGGPILGLNPHAAKARLEALPWVRQATVERRPPGLVHVRLIERRPLALWQRDGKLMVIDRSGAVIRGAKVERFTHLPLVVGEDAPGHAAELLAMLDSEPDLKAMVAAAVRIRGRRWNVRLDRGIDVRLPERGAADAWARLARMQREHRVLERDVVLIDLRMPDRLVVRTAPGAPAKNRGTPAGEDT
ncbi:MAG: cell division protein FtsQ/DivIB [Kiloniellaceae bacterium]